MEARHPLGCGLLAIWVTNMKLDLSKHAAIERTRRHEDLRQVDVFELLKLARVQSKLHICLLALPYFNPV
jgi:hypothetical protein